MASPGDESKWQHSDGGALVPPRLQSDFLDWLLADDKGGINSQKAWAAANGVNNRTVRSWKNDPRFRAEWEQRARKKNVSPERLQGVLDTLYRVAVEQGDVGAAKLYLDQVNKLLPPKPIVDEEEFARLSDEELVAQLKAELGVE